jgi:hypothetical protein
MQSVPDVTGFRKYSKRKFKSVRLRKKQISRLRGTYHRLSKKHKCRFVHASVTGDIKEVEAWMFAIDMIANSVETFNRLEKGEFRNPYKDDNTPTRQYEKLIEEQKTKSS